MTDELDVRVGDCRDVLPTLDAGSVHCVVTSPPYWGLRDYGTASWDGGDPECDHTFDRSLGGRASTLGGGKDTQVKASVYRDCHLCGARRIDRQLGLEATPEEYVANMVAVFREVRRVLRDDGTVWLVLGDSYASIGRSARDESPGVGAKQEMRAVERKVTWRAGGGHNFSWSIPSFGTQIKPKDLVGIPWRVAFALQADGWYLRSDIIWSKPNPMPESVTDRPTKAHEYVFLLSKRATYFFDADAVREPTEEYHVVAPDSWAVGQRSHDVVDFSKRERGRATDILTTEKRSGRNIRSVWNIATQPYPGAHFATFPERLVEPCVKAGCPVGGTVLDPFAGSGTVGRVAIRLRRRALLIELNPDYAGEQIDSRTAVVQTELLA